jgi:hypothetical protein
MGSVRLQSRAAVAAHRRRARGRQMAERARCWKRTVSAGGCVMCRTGPVDAAVRAAYGAQLAEVQAHHVIPRSDLKRMGLHDYLWDERNGIGLCAYHHHRHTVWRERMPRELVPAAAYEFAEELGIGWLLDREYR